MPKQQIFRTGWVFACCLWLAGCAGPLGLFNAETTTPPFRDPDMSMQTASERITLGKTSKAEVLAALGRATEIKFDSGFEVWVYRVKSGAAPAARAEFVILLAPSGIVKKARIRPPYPPYDGKAK